MPEIQVTLAGPGIAYICLGGFAVAVRSYLLLILVFLNCISSSPSFLFLPEKRSAHILSVALLKRLPFIQLCVNEVVLGTLFGIFMGPYFAGVFDPRSWGSDSNEITLEVMRVVLATGLFAIGVELPKSYMARHAKSLLAMVVPTMAIGWAIVAGVYSLLARYVFTNPLFLKVFSVSYFLNWILYPAWLFLLA